MTDEEKVKNFLPNATHMVLAVTLDDGTPWAVPITIQSWKGNVFGWDSKLDTVHSKALTMNPNAAVTIFEQGQGAEIGVYMKGQAKLEIDRGDGFGSYAFTADRVWLNDESFAKREVHIGKNWGKV